MKIFIASTQYPGYGGAATNTYAIYNHLNISSCGTANKLCCGFFLAHKGIDIDPLNIHNVLSIDPCDKHKAVPIVERMLDGSPDLIICKNNLAPVYCRDMWPDVKIIFLACGLDYMDSYGTVTAQEIITGKKSISPSKRDIKAITSSNITVFNSKMLMNVYKRLYAKYSNKFYKHIIDTTELIIEMVNCYSKIRRVKPPKKSKLDEILESNYDILITTSIMTRVEKNNKFLVDLLMNDNNTIFHDKTKILIIGDNNALFSNVPNATVIDRIEHYQLQQVMKNCKVLLYPSLFDANPNTIREAVYHGCVPIVSNNIGGTSTFPDELVCTTYDQSEWVEKINGQLSSSKVDCKRIQFDKDNCVPIEQLINDMLTN